METREGALPAAPVDTRSGRLAGGMGRATVTALSALVGCALLIAVGTLMSICWAIYPALTLVAAAAVIWLASRGVGLLMRSGSRRCS